jgi:hypothetical protein
MRSRVKILYMMRASAALPTFVVFTNRAVKLRFPIRPSAFGHADLDQEQGEELALPLRQRVR